jgi:hypothetical protein
MRFKSHDAVKIRDAWRVGVTALSDLGESYGSFTANGFFGHVTPDLRPCLAQAFARLGAHFVKRAVP